jgi:hypothetical protein
VLRRSHIPTLALLGALFITAPALADDISDEINRARKLYDQGKLSEAKESLELAAQLIAEKKAVALGAVLPASPNGWQGEKVESTMGTAGLFGGISASRRYRKDGTQCTISVVGDSPLLAMVSTVITNPAVASVTGSRMRRIAGRRALITPDGDVQVLSANSYLVTVSGPCDEEDKLELAGTVNYKALDGF